MSEPTFGRRIVGATAEDTLIAEAAAGRDGRFTSLDAFLGHIAASSFAGHPVVGVTKARRGAKTDSVTVLGIEAEHRQLLDDSYRLGRQEAKGAWFLPQEVSLKYGLCNLPALTAKQPRFAMNAARDAVAKVDLGTNGDALAVWSLLIPLFTDLLAPINARTATGKLPSPDEQVAAWKAIEDTYRNIGLELDAQLATMRYGGSWSRLRIDAQTDAKQAFVAALAANVGANTIRRWRVHATQPLVAAYYRKAKSGPPLARAVLTKPLQTRLAGLFGGDWLDFLDYIGERPNEGEKIAAALPEPRLYVGGSAKAAAVAAEHGLTVDEVERMLSALLGRSTGRSPVEERVAVLRRWWEAFDEAHAAQRPGMPPLWGLVDEGIELIASGQGSIPGLYRDLLPADLCAEIDRLWDGVTLPRWPERIVSEFHPHRQMAETFGAAAALWNGVALTCWYICEGPSSRTSLKNLADYHARHLVELEEIGFPVDRTLFEELTAAEHRLGPPEMLERSEEVRTTSGVTITMGVSMGERRDGFEILRDIITRHRRAWSSQHLDAYLRHRWHSELREVAYEFNRHTAARNKPPTFKQFARVAVPAANHWFGGDLVAVHAALGERSPTTTARHDLLAGDPFDFAYAVYTALGGGPIPEGVSGPEAARQWELRRFASEALRYLQQYEALGRPPTQEEFGTHRLRWEHVGGEEAGWKKFQDVIEAARVLRSPAKPRGMPALANTVAPPGSSE